MNRQEAKDYINSCSPDVYLQHAKKKGYVCPTGCGSGTGKTGTGVSVDPHSDRQHNYYKCFNCGFRGDNIEMIKEYFNLKDFNEALEKGCELYGITIDDNGYVPKAETPAPVVMDQEKETDYTDDLQKWYDNMQETDNDGLLYLQGRGISKELIDRFRIGYCSNWVHPKATHAPASPRVIIPTSNYSYLARDIRKDVPVEAEKYTKSKAGKIRPFNLQAISDASDAGVPVFIEEGEINALSIIEAGGQAVALGSTAYVQIFLDSIKNIRITTPFIIALDNDTAGKDATVKLINAFKERKIEYYICNPNSTYNDANDALTASRDSFIETVQAITENPAKWQYERNSVSNYIADFLGQIDASVDTPAIPTGFKELDNVLDGGLFEGLYVIGAISSLGKTTFIQQVADQVAKQGQDVLYISLEMARTELMSKSISRHTWERCRNHKDAKTARGITQGSRWQYYTDAEKDLIYDALNDYAGYSKHLYIHEGVGDIGVQQVAELTEKHITITGNNPVLIIDYLQILNPYNERYSDKQNTDKAILELKRLSRTHKIPVIVISSFNRNSYKSAVTMQAFKESGSIEYGSDVLIGLQLEGAENMDNDELEQELANEIRHIELKILKNRNGGRPEQPLRYDYRPMFNYFKEHTTTEGSTGGKRRIVI